MKQVDIIAITISSPLKIGIYRDNILADTIESSKKTSDVLATIFSSLLDKYEVKRIFYTKGPGSFMAIKLAYVFFKTLSLTKDIELLASDGFMFNKNSPIPSIGKMFFIKKDDGKVVIDRWEEYEKIEFILPEKLEEEKFSKDVEPLYIAPAA